MDGKAPLVVDDERDALELLRYNLAGNGDEVVSAMTGEEALRLTAQAPPDVVVLDLMLPGVDGLDVCRRSLKASRELAAIPIVILSAKGDEADIVAGLELGAYDYVCKPFSPRVLIARIRACLRYHSRRRKPANEVVRYGGLRIDPPCFGVSMGGELLELTATEFRVLHFLAARPGRVFTRNQIIRDRSRRRVPFQRVVNFPSAGRDGRSSPETPARQLTGRRLGCSAAGGLSSPRA